MTEKPDVTRKKPPTQDLNEVLYQQLYNRPLSEEEQAYLDSQLEIVAQAKGWISFKPKPAFFSNPKLFHARLDPINGNCYHIPNGSHHPYYNWLLAINKDIYTFYPVDRPKPLLARAEPNKMLQGLISDILSSRNPWQSLLIPNWKYNYGLKKSRLTLGVIDNFARNLKQKLDNIDKYYLDWQGGDRLNIKIVETGYRYFRRWEVSVRDINGIGFEFAVKTDNKVFYLEI